MKARLLSSIIVLLTLISLKSSVNGQTVQWAKKGISPGFENGNAIVADDSGNVYVTGQIEFTSVFDSYSLSVYGQHDIVVAKYNPAGNIVWIRKAGGTSGDIGLGIGIDKHHNVYVTGEFEKTAKFSSSVSLTSAGGNDGFLAKYDANGNVVWAKKFGHASSSDKGRAIAVSTSGNCYITGNFSNTVTFGSTSLSSSGGNDIFIVKYDKNGNVIWAKKAGGSRQDRGYGIAIDATENVFVTGSFTSSAKFKSTTITNTGKMSTFLAKYNSGGTFQWVKASGNCCDTTQAGSVALDGDGNIYIAGSFAGKAKFSSTTLQSAGLRDIFLAKYSPSGSLLWAKRAGGSKDDFANGVTVDASRRRVYITGFVETAGSISGLSYPFSGYKDVIVASYNLDGDAKWVKTYGGSRRDIGLAITTNLQGNIYVTGLFNGNAVFGSTTLTGYPNQYWADLFVMKIVPPVSTPFQAPTSASDAQFIQNESNFREENADMKNEGSPLDQMKIYPNPFSGNFILKVNKEVSFKIYDMLGNLILRKENVTGEITEGENLSSGNYFLEITDGVTRRTVPLIKRE